MALQSLDTTLLQALGGEKQVHTQAASNPSHRDKEVQEVGANGLQFGNLLDDYYQMGHRLHLRIGLPDRLVLLDIVEIASIVQQVLPALLLAQQREVHAVDQRNIGLQVGDDPGHMRQGLKVGEGSAPFEIDQHKVQGLRIVRNGQPSDQGTQQLAFAGAGCADNQAVRPHPMIGCLFKIEVNQAPI